MVDLIRPFPGESEESFIKRKAYYFRILKKRFEYGNQLIENYSPNGIPITASEKEEIDAFWDKFLKPEQRDQLVDYRFYDVFKNLNKGKPHRLSYYIPDTFFYTYIDDYFTNPQHSNPCDDKNLYDLYFHDIQRPVTVFRMTNGFILDDNYNEISLNDAISLCRDENEVILKETKYSYGGKGIMFWNSQSPTEDLLKFLNESPNMICQRVIRQHAELSRLNHSSVNTIRIMTLVFGGQVHLLSSVVRMGIKGSRVDNASSGGIVCGIEQNGQLKDVAYSASGEKFLKHPQGTTFDSVTVPNFNDCCELVTILAKRLSSISRLISWDIAIDEAGNPLLIEFNASYGELDFHQYCNGPIFGDLTEEVLDDVFNNSYTLKSILKSMQ